MRRAPTGRSVGRDLERRRRRRLGEALDRRARPGRATAPGCAVGAADADDLRRAASVSTLDGLRRRALGDEDGAGRDRGAQAHRAAHARAVGAELDLVAVADAEALGVARARARRPAAGAGTAAPARRRPPWRPTASGRCRAAARPSWPAARGPARDLQRDRLPRRRLRTSRPPRARASARRGRRSRRASARRRTGPRRRAAWRPSGRRRRRGRARRARRRRRSPASRRARRRPASALARPIAARRRCTRPSGCTSVPSFSAYASAGKTTSAYSRTVSVSTDSWAMTVWAAPSACSHSARSGCVRSGSACSR